MMIFLDLTTNLNANINYSIYFLFNFFFVTLFIIFPHSLHFHRCKFITLFIAALNVKETRKVIIIYSLLPSLSFHFSLSFLSQYLLKFSPLFFLSPPQIPNPVQYRWTLISTQETKNWTLN